MKPIAFASSNNVKFSSAQVICQPYGIELEQVIIDIDEIQGEDPELIIRAKAKAAYAAYGKPVVVSDDTWDIPALRGFPGAYMKSINYWFTPDDFIRLMKGVSDRSAILHQHLAYIDEYETVIFSTDLHGTVLDEVRGFYEEKSPWMSVVAMDADNGESLAEVWSSGKQSNPERYKKMPEAWHELAKWYKRKFE